MMRTGLSGAVKCGIVLSIVLGLAGCVTAPLYDDQTDKLISQLQTEVDTELVSLISLNDQIAELSGQTDAASQKALADDRTKASYASALTFYQKIDVDLIGLKTRIDAEPTRATPQLDSALKLLTDNLIAPADSLQAIHKRDQIIPSAELVTIQGLVDAQLGALLARELNLKGSQTSGGAGSPKATPAAP